MQYINQLDHAFSIALNSFHTEALDVFMLWVSNKYTWIPLYVFLIGLLIYQFKKTSWIAILSIVAIITISDRFTSGLMKPYFERLRPCHDTSLSQSIILVGNCGGEYGMASSHAANAFALACFLILVFHKKNKLIWTMLPWAILVGYSRVFLGVHFAGDVLVGMLIGFLTTLVIYLPLKKHFDY